MSLQVVQIDIIFISKRETLIIYETPLHETVQSGSSKLYVTTKNGLSQ